MRSLLAVVTWCLYVGILEASDSVFIPGNTHTYNYSIVLSTSTSSGDPQYAVVAYKTKVRVDAISSHKVIIQFERVEVATENKELRKLEVESSQFTFKELPEYSDKLRIPFEVDFQNGKVEKISFAQEDPLWSRDMKKGLAQLVQAQVKSPSSRNDNRLSKQNQKGPSFYVVKEPSLSGVCETQYILNRIQSPSRPQANVLNVTKIRDYKQCDDEVFFVKSNHPAYKCSDCEADKSHPISKNAIISLNLRATQDGHYLLEDGSSTGIIKVAPLGEEADHYIALCNKTIELVSVRALSGQVEIHTDRQETLVSTMTEQVEEAVQDRHRKEPITIPYITKSGSLEQIRSWIGSVAEVIDKADNTKKTWRTALSHVNLIVKDLSQLNIEQLEQIRSTFRQQRSSSQDDVSSRDSTKRDLFLDLLAQSGTYPALLIWKKATENQEFTPLRSLNFIQVFATHCQFPRPQILDVILEIINSDAVRQHEQLQTTILMSYATLVSRTCLRYKPYFHNPVNPKTLCPEPQKYIQPLVALLEKSSNPAIQIAAVNALGETKLRDAILPLKEYALGEATDCDILQAQAVFAITKCAKLHPEAAKTIFHSIYYNLEHDTTVRIAALTGLFAASLTRHQMEKLAMFTWKETDTTVGSFLIKSLEAMANSSHPCFAYQTSHAEHALSLIDEEFNDGLPLVMNKFYEKDIPELDVSALLTASYVSDGHPFAPQMAYANVRPQIAGFNPDILRLSWLASGSKSAIDQLVGPASAFQDQSFTDILRNIDEPNRNLGLKDLAQKLGLRQREDDETKGVLKMTWLGGQHRVIYYNKEKLLQWASTASSVLRKLEQGIDIDYRRTVMPIDMSIVTPTPAGLPFVFYIRSPMHYGLKGHVRVKLDGSSGRGIENIQELSVDLKLKPVFAMKMLPMFGVKLPAEHTMIGASYSTMIVAQPYIAGKVTVKRENGLKIVIKPEQPNHKILFHFSTLPMTYLIKYSNNKPLFENALPITFLEKPKVDSVELGFSEYKPVVVKLEQDTFWHSRASIFDWLCRHSCPSALPFIWLTQSYKNRDYTVEYQKSSSVLSPFSQNPEIEIQLSYNHEVADAKPQKKVSRGFKGILTYLLGWARPADTCDRETTSSHKPWQVPQINRQRTMVMKHMRHSSEEGDLDNIWSIKRSKSSNRYSDDDSEEGNQYDEEYDDRDSDVTRVDYDQSQANYRSDRYSEHRFSDDSSSSHGQAHVRLANTRHGVSKLELQARAFIRGLESHPVTAKLILERHQADIKKLVSLTVNIPNRHIQKVCLRGNVHWPRRPCYLGAELPSYRHKEFRTDFQLQWGQDCASPLGFVDFKMVAKKSPEQIKLDSLPATADIKPWFYAQCEKDRSKGIPFSDACTDCLNHLARLNHISVVATYEKIPPVVKNITRHIAFALAAKYYKYLDYDPVEISNPSKKFEVELNYHYDMPAVDAHVSVPLAEVHIRKFPYRRVSQLLGPINVRRSLGRKIAHLLTEDAVYATAFVSGHTVNTFDNQTYSYKQWGQCKHVLAMDCSSSHMFAVLTKPARDPKQKELIVRILDHTIELDATESKRENLTINGLPQKIGEHERVFVRDNKFDMTVAYITKSADQYIVVLPQVGLLVGYDGYTIFVAMSQMWQDKVCGVFGDFDNDFIYEFRGPKQCAYENGAEMAKAYAIADGTCSPPRVTSQKVCDLEEDSQRSSVLHSGSRSSCYYEKTLREDKEGRICVSKRPVQRCSPGCHPSRESSKSIDFTCLEKEDPQTVRQLRQLDANRPLYDVRDRPVHFRKSVPIPEECSHQYKHISA